ncbi:MAG TPA: hypothetical protein VFH43_07695 [Candidatus Kapabacteria bacterium]|nr:hypothetical protein [Candidatus Kapabacteria bacterium]
MIEPTKQSGGETESCSICLLEATRLLRRIDRIAICAPRNDRTI